MQRTCSSPLSVGNAAWRPNSCYSFEELKQQWQNHLHGLHCLVSLLFNSSERHNFKLTCYCLHTEPNKNMKQRAEPVPARSRWNRTGFAHHQQDCLILVELKKRHLGKRTVVLFLEEQHNAKHCFLHLHSADFQWWEEVVPLKNLLKTRQSTLFFKIKLKITGFF